MINLIPMAGAGSRFAQEGYTTPKPLIEVSGLPMIIQAANSLPEPDKWIFMCRTEHVDEWGIDGILRSRFENAEVMTVDEHTEGQAYTCKLAAPRLDLDDSLMIGACDNGMLFDREKANTLMSDPSVDALIWTFRDNVTTKRNPTAYGWVRTEGDRALEVSCKAPISDTPMQDHAIVGAFYFRTGQMFMDAVETQVERDRRVNGEFYVDITMNELIEAGLNVRVFEIEKYVCWGTPNDLRTYEYWESYFGETASGETTFG